MTGKVGGDDNVKVELGETYKHSGSIVADTGNPMLENLSFSQTVGDGNAVHKPMDCAITTNDDGGSTVQQGVMAGVDEVDKEGDAKVEEDL